VQLPITCYTFGADFINGSDGDTKAEIEKAKKNIDIAKVLGVSVVRHDATVGNEKYRTFDDTLDILANACREITIYAQEKGIKTTIENHGFFCQDSDRVEKLVAAVNHKNFGLLTDMGNFLCADEDPAKAFSKVARYAFYAHAKDFHVKSAMLPNPGSGFFRSRGGNFLRGAIIGHGDVPIKQCIQALKQAGYDGYIAIEFEGMEEVIPALKIGLENLRNYII
jgi:sugar phosphate isomerase/epimerase